MRNARSKSTFKPRWRQRTSGKAGKRQGLLKGVTSSASEETYDPEVTSWASRVIASGGGLSSATIDAANTFLRSINASVGLRAKIKRLNLFCGSNLSASLTPLIADVGPIQDTNTNFISSEYTASTGLANSSGAGNKYLDTGIDFADAGISFTNGHMAINTLGSNTSSSYKEWIGRDYATIGSSLNTGKHHFRWGEHLLEADNTNPQTGTSMGFYLGNATAAEVSLFLNDNKKITKAISSNSPSGAIDKNFYIFKRNTIYTNPNDFDKTVNFYSIGTSLTDAEAKIMYDALAVFNQSSSREVYDAQDVEVWKWANHRVQEVVGDISNHINGAIVQAADKWMLDLKKFNLRNKISRANLFLGASSTSYGYLSALVPLIIDSGNRLDINYGFVSSDFNLKNGLFGNGLTKYLDTGVIGGKNHLSVTTGSIAKITTGSVATNALIGSVENTNTPGAGGVSISLSSSEMFSRTYDKSRSSIISSSEGSFLVNIPSLSAQELYYNGELLNTESLSLGSWVASGNKTITLFGINTGSTNIVDALSSQSIKEYTIGDALTQDEVSNLNTANSGILRDELSAVNSEVYEWANQTVPANGGVLTQREVDAVDAWMTKIKSVSGLQSKIKRANLMIGGDLASKLVPIISTLGSPKDVARELYDSDANIKGVNGGDSKYIDTTVKLSEFLTNSSGHFSVQQAKDFVPNSNGNAHGVFSTGSTKPKFGIQFDNNSVDSYIYNTANPASFNLSNAPTSSTIWGSSNDGSAVSAILPNGISFTVGSDTTAWRLYAPSTGLMNFSFKSCIYSSGPGMGLVGRELGISSGARTAEYSFDVYLNGVFAKKYVSPKCWCEDACANVAYSFAVDVQAGDLVSVKVRANESILMVLEGEAGGEYIDTSILIGNQSEDVSGLWTANRTSTTSLSLYQGSTSKATSTSEVSGSVVNRDDFVYVLAAYGEDGSMTKDFSSINSHMGFYSIGEGLTNDQVTGLSEAYTIFESTLKRSLDAEVWDWAYKRVPENGGVISDTEAASISTFMTSIKATSGLREALRRLNVFGGTDLASAMVPLIRDVGNSLDTNYNFVNSDMDEGLSSSGNKYLSLGASFSQIPNASFQNFHIAVSAKGESLPSAQTAYVLGDSSIKLDLNNTSAKLNYASKTITSSSTGNAFWVASQESSATNLYKNGTSTASGTFDSSGTASTKEFILFGSLSGDSAVSSFAGRVSLYSFGTALTSAQQSAYNTAVTALEISLQRGNYSASTAEAWKWANVNVVANNGVVTQAQVSAVDKFMKSVNSIPNLRSSIKRMNLFVGNDLSAALVPIVSDLGSVSDTNNYFVSGDYTAGGLNAGLKSDGLKTLDTTVKAGAGIPNDWHMSFRSPDGVTSTRTHQAVMGAERGFNVTKLGHSAGVPYFALGTRGDQTITYNESTSYVSDFKNPIKIYNGCSINAGNISGPSVNKGISEADCENIAGGVSTFTSSPVNDKINNFADSSSASSTQYFQGDNLVAFDKGPSDGIKGLYSLIVSPNGTASATDTKVRFYKDGYKIQESSIDKMNSPPSDDEIAIFGVKNQGTIFPTADSLTINFYCFGNGPEAASTQNTDTLDDNFLPNEINNFLNELDKDLNRGGYSVSSSTPLITSALDPEVSDWANNRVPKAGGKLSESIVKHVDTFMRAIKARSGLRSKISRCNLFAGLNLHASLVPIIIDVGYPVDVNKGSTKFLEADYLLSSGLTAANISSRVGADHPWPSDPAEKYIDTGFKAGGLFTDSAGHISFATSDKNITGPAYEGQVTNGSRLVPMSLLDGKGVSQGNVSLSIFSAGVDQPFYPYAQGSNWYSAVWGQPEGYVPPGPSWRRFDSWYVNKLQHFPQNTISLLNMSSGKTTLSTGGVYFDGTQHKQGTADYSTLHNQGGTTLPNDSTLTLFGTSFGKDSTHFAQGGRITPSRSSLTPVLLDDGKYYVFALTEEEYSLANLITPSGFSKSETVRKYIEDKYGYGWSSVTYSNVSSLWTTTASDNNLQLGRLIQDLKHQHIYDKPIGWLDILNGESLASDIAGYETRLLFHNNKTKNLNNYSTFSLDVASKTMIRNVIQSKTDKACVECTYEMTKAPLLIKAEVPNPSAALSETYQSWNNSISFYSAGGELSDADVTTLNTAYKAFAESVGRTIEHYSYGGMFEY